MPRPALPLPVRLLNTAFAALGNDQAAALLRPSLDRHDYATELVTARELDGLQFLLGIIEEAELRVTRKPDRLELSLDLR